MILISPHWRIVRQTQPDKINLNQAEDSAGRFFRFETTMRLRVRRMIAFIGDRLSGVVRSERFKKEIKPTDQASEAILQLRPVTFHYKSDASDTPQFGLIAEEVEKVNRDLIVRNEDGEIYTVRYEAVNAMLLNEFLKEHRKVEGINIRRRQSKKRQSPHSKRSFNRLSRSSKRKFRFSPQAWQSRQRKFGRWTRNLK